MDEYKGILSQYNLWDFWNNLPGWVKDKIIHYFENTPLMFDYRNLFSGNWKRVPHTTPISIIQTLFVCKDLEICDLFYAKVKQYSKSTTSEWYWVDLHFFLLIYNKNVYKHYLHKECDETRFMQSYNIEHTNINSIIDTLKAKGLFPVRNPIIEQYLIYLEKRKKFKEVISLAEWYKEQGWTNDFEKRIKRCEKKS